MRSRFGLVIGVLALAGLAAPPGAAAAVDTIVVTFAGGAEDTDFDYVPGSDNLPLPAILPTGQTLLYRNLHTGLPHDLTSTMCVDDASGEQWEDLGIGGSCERLAPLTDGARLFGSDVAGYNQQVPVHGTSSLAPGEHPFYCAVHGQEMAGRLQVVGLT